MADNLGVTTGSDATVRTTDNAGVHTPHHIVASSALPTGAATESSLATVAALSRAEDAAHSDGHTGVMALAVRKDTSSTGIGADGDYVPLAVDANGRLYVTAPLLEALIADSKLAVFATIDPASQNPNDRAAAADSAPVVLSTEDFTVLGAIETAAELIDDAIVADDAAFTPGTTKVMMAGFQADESSTDSVNEGDAGAARMTLDRKIIVTPQPHTAGGLSIHRNLDVDESEDDIKTSPGCLYKLRITNRTTSIRYVKLYNDTAANVTVGTTTPIETIPVPAAAASDVCVITEAFGGMGLRFDTALSIAATTGLADNDTGAPGANDVVVSAYYL
mgnify:CR=1 FL=1